MSKNIINKGKRKAADLGVDSCIIYPTNDYCPEYIMSCKSIFKRNNYVYSSVFFLLSHPGLL